MHYFAVALLWMMGREQSYCEVVHRLSKKSYDCLASSSSLEFGNLYDLLNIVFIIFSN
jgi:hypothetical protein